MFDLLFDLGKRASAALAAHFPPQTVPGEKAPAGTIPEVLPIARAGKPEFGDYQISACLQLAKALGKPPRDLAKIVVDALTGHEALGKIEIAGPGFINLHVTDEYLAAQTAALVDDPRLGLRNLGEGQRVVIDYSSPNVAKPLHIAHIRSTIIGAAIDRVLRALGYTVIGDNHLGDWGTQFGKLIVAYRKWLDPEAYARDAVAELLRLYTAFNLEEKKQLEAMGLSAAAAEAELDEEASVESGPGSDQDPGQDPGRAPDAAEKPAKPVAPILEEARRELVKLQAGDPDNQALWQKFVDDSRHVFDEIYKRLGVRFDYYLGESSYNAMLPTVVEDLMERGIAEVSRGAKVVFIDEKPFIVQKADGGFNYASTDVATMAVRTGVPAWPHMPAGPFNAQRVIIITDERQQLHFKQLFAVSRRLGVTAELEHVWFGLMRLPEGVIKTRDASKGIIFLADLLDEAERRAYAVAAEKFAERAAEQEPSTAPAASEADLREVARVVGIGAVKYNDLSKDRQTIITFTWDKALSLQGNTAPYLQYAYARIRSIVRKAAQSSTGSTGQDKDKRGGIVLGSKIERELAKKILAYPEAVEQVGRTLRPNVLCDYLFELATAFSGFYADHPVLKAEPEVRASRLALTDLVARTIRDGLALLGIETLERM